MYLASPLTTRADEGQRCAQWSLGKKQPGGRGPGDWEEDAHLVKKPNHSEDTKPNHPKRRQRPTATGKAEKREGSTHHIEVAHRRQVDCVTVGGGQGQPEGSTA